MIAIFLRRSYKLRILPFTDRVALAGEIVWARTEGITVKGTFDADMQKETTILFSYERRGLYRRDDDANPWVLDSLIDGTLPDFVEKHKVNYDRKAAADFNNRINASKG